MSVVNKPLKQWQQNQLSVSKLKRWKIVHKYIFKNEIIMEHNVVDKSSAGKPESAVVNVAASKIKPEPAIKRNSKSIMGLARKQ